MIRHPSDCQYDLGIGPTLSQLYKYLPRRLRQTMAGQLSFIKKKIEDDEDIYKRSKVLCNYLLSSKTLVCTRKCWRSNWCTLISMTINNYILAPKTNMTNQRFICPSYLQNVTMTPYNVTFGLTMDTAEELHTQNL